jgi:threonine synthase
VTGARVVAPQTIATAIRIGNPASWQQALDAGTSPAATSSPSPTGQILSPTGCSPAEGVFVEPASAASVAGLLQAHAAGSSRRAPGWSCTVTGQRPQGPRLGHLRRPKPVTVANSAEAAAAALGLA